MFVPTSNQHGCLDIGRPFAAESEHMFDLAEWFVWDFWHCHDGEVHHLFFLRAPRSLGDPDLRHNHARVGHAISRDLDRWEVIADPFPQPIPGFDDLATWTGSVHRVGEHWLTLLTGRSRREGGAVQRVAAAWSTDLVGWEFTGVVIEADPRWYQTWPDYPETHWRDPWLECAADGTWHLYLTARGLAPGRDNGAGVIGHATSTDLQEWTVHPPLNRPTGRFGWQEVVSIAEVEGRRALLFSCLADQMPGASPGSGGVWSLPYGPAGSSLDPALAVRVTDESAYVGKVVEHDGSAYFLAFRNDDSDGGFIGGIADPVPIRWREDGRGLELNT